MDLETLGLALPVKVLLTGSPPGNTNTEDPTSPEDQFDGMWLMFKAHREELRNGPEWLVAGPGGVTCPAVRGARGYPAVEDLRSNALGSVEVDDREVGVGEAFENARSITSQGEGMLIGPRLPSEDGDPAKNYHPYQQDVKRDAHSGMGLASHPCYPHARFLHQPTVGSWSLTVT